MKKINGKRDSSLNKIPRIENEPSVATGFLVWQVGAIDMHGAEWGWDKIDRELLFNEIFPKLKNFETMTWGQVLAQGNHEVSTSQICQDAKKRLEKLKLDDYDKIVSLRLSGKQRIWGIRNKDILRLLWWDPEHQVYPSRKKHT